MTDVVVRTLGRAPFAETLTAMRSLADAVAGGRREGEIWLLEHEPVYTAGRATPPHDLAASGAVSIERGGQITYHGPGQLVVYPIVRLPERDVGAWLRRLERFGAAVCAAFGLHAEASADGTGVFVAGRKVGSIGVALRRWVNLHGIAINVDLDLAPFFEIRPCGLAPETITDLTRAAGRPVSMTDAIAAAAKAVAQLVQTAADPAGGDRKRHLRATPEAPARSEPTSSPGSRLGTSASGKPALTSRHGRHDRA